MSLAAPPSWLVQQAGSGNTIQDLGRHGLRHQGVPLAGALDPWLLKCANALVANPLDAACIEMCLMGPSLVCTQGPAKVALAGDAEASITRAGGHTQSLPAWHSATLYPQDQVRVTRVFRGCAYLALEGGMALTPVMGSRSTCGSWLDSGPLSRPLTDGDAWQGAACASVDSPALRAPAWQPNEVHGGHSQGVVLRAMLGPQAAAFESDSLHRFWSQIWRTTSAQDRMGMRLAGEALRLAPAHRKPMVSDAVTPGAIQVPADGQPIVLLNDCQTMGGYPKIAVVIQADLPRLAHCPPSTELRWQSVTAAQADAASVEISRAWQTWQGQVRPYQEPGFLDPIALGVQNLISGVVMALPEKPPGA